MSIVEKPSVTVAGPPGSRLWRGTWNVSNCPGHGQVELFLLDLNEANAYETQAVVRFTGLFRNGEVSVAPVSLVPALAPPATLSGFMHQRNTYIQLKHDDNTATTLDLTFQTWRPSAVGTASVARVEPAVASIQVTPVKSISLIG